MEPVTGSRLDRVHLHLDALRLALKPLQEMSATEGSTLPGRLVAAQLSIAVAELQAINNQMQLDADAPADAARVACAFCGKLMMPAATLCGYCWRRRDEPKSAAA